MGIWDTITDLVEAATPWSTVEAEAPSSNPAGGGPAKESAVRRPPLQRHDFAGLPIAQGSSGSSGFCLFDEFTTWTMLTTFTRSRRCRPRP